MVSAAASTASITAKGVSGLVQPGIIFFDSFRVGRHHRLELDGTVAALDVRLHHPEQICFWLRADDFFEQLAVAKEQ